MFNVSFTYLLLVCVIRFESKMQGAIVWGGGVILFGGGEFLN